MQKQEQHIQLELFQTIPCQRCAETLTADANGKLDGFWDKERDMIVHFKCRGLHYRSLIGTSNEGMTYKEYPLTLKFYEYHIKNRNK
jgi:hypothetical protein